MEGKSRDYKFYRIRKIIILWILSIFKFLDNFGIFQQNRYFPKLSKNKFLVGFLYLKLLVTYLEVMLPHKYKTQSLKYIDPIIIFIQVSCHFFLWNQKTFKI